MRPLVGLAILLLLTACATQAPPQVAGVGQATERYPNGEVYVGDIRDGLRNEIGRAHV